MKKQEALEAVLAKMRTWEKPGAEMPDRNPDRVYREMVRSFDALSGMGNIHWPTPGGRHYLTIIGAGALYLMRDEVEVVEGKSLDEWLAEKEKQAVPVGQVVATKRNGQVTMLPSSYQPSPINGAMVQAAYDKGLRDGRSGG